MLSHDTHASRNAPATLALASLLVLPAKVSGAERQMIEARATPTKPITLPWSFLMGEVLGEIGNSLPSFVRLRISPFQPPSRVDD
jgi:hypothetical protein